MASVGSKTNKLFSFSDELIPNCRILDIIFSVPYFNTISVKLFVYLSYYTFFINHIYAFEDNSSRKIKNIKMESHLLCYLLCFLYS